MHVKMRGFLILLLVSGTFVAAFSQQIAQWRGPYRNGNYNETGLLKQWPAHGPELLWHMDELGFGHASATVTNELVYTSGMDSDENGFIIAFDNDGNEKWRSTYGKEWNESYEGTRSTPLIYDGKVYMLSSFGDLACLDAKNGSGIWSINIFSDYDGRNIKWGVTENLLIDENVLYVTPGGDINNVLALNKDNGELIWSSEAKNELSAYCSPLIIERGNKKIFITQTESFVFGLDAANGELLWSYSQPNRWSVHANTPVYHDGMLYVFSGYGQGGVMLKLSENGDSVEKIWKDEKLDSKMGGVVLVDGRIYGSGDNNKCWLCLDWNTGDVLYESKMMKVGNIIYADGLLYLYGQGGKVAIVDPASDDYNPISTFNVPYGEKYHWAHLVIHNKRLYVRHGESLMVYDISANN